MEFEQYEQKLTTEELAAFEQQYNITLPKAFKEHYLQYNGGYSSVERFYFWLYFHTEKTPILFERTVWEYGKL